VNSDQFSWTPDPPAHQHAWTRVYRRTGRTAHIRELIYAAHEHAPAAWGSRDEGWLGTGSQEEYDKAETLPSCARCVLIQAQF